MTDTLMLEQKIKDSGHSKKWIAEQIGLTYYGLHKKITNANEFKAVEIKALCELLGITSLREREDIFFKD